MIRLFLLQPPARLGRRVGAYPPQFKRLQAGCLRRATGDKSIYCNEQNPPVLFYSELFRRPLQTRFRRHFEHKFASGYDLRVLQPVPVQRNSVQLDRPYVLLPRRGALGAGRPSRRLDPARPRSAADARLGRKGRRGHGHARPEVQRDRRRGADHPRGKCFRRSCAETRACSSPQKTCQ